MTACLEQGPIRPPSEARSLLIRATRNCPWNKCAFCGVYKGEKFSLRSRAEVEEEIDSLAQMADFIKELSIREGEDGRVSARLVRTIFDRPALYNDFCRTVAVWLYDGGENVFIQDADSLIMPTADLTSILNRLKAAFPNVKRVTTYCRSKTAAHKTPADLARLRKAGLTRIHVGMESGSDQVLKFMRKGVTAAQHIEGGLKIKAAGFSLCQYVMPGLGGKKMSLPHAHETARVINAVNPDFVRLRTLHVTSGSCLRDMTASDKFKPLNDEDILREIQTLLGALEGVQTTIVSDHILNLLEELEGRLPDDKERMLAVLARYFALSEEDRLVYQLGRRQGVYRRLDDLQDEKAYRHLQAVVIRYETREKGSLERYLSGMMRDCL